jgi:hypothetical protein
MYACIGRMLRMQRSPTYLYVCIFKHGNVLICVRRGSLHKRHYFWFRFSLVSNKEYPDRYFLGFLSLFGKTLGLYFKLDHISLSLSLSLFLVHVVIHYSLPYKCLILCRLWSQCWCWHFIMVNLVTLFPLTIRYRRLLVLRQGFMKQPA